jgi:hypothetical protein
MQDFNLKLSDERYYQTHLGLLERSYPKVAGNPKLPSNHGSRSLFDTVAMTVLKMLKQR